MNSQKAGVLLLTFSLLAGIFAASGCGQRDEPKRADMTLKELIDKYGNAPVDQSIDAVAKRLAASSVFVAIEEGAPDPNKLRFKVAADKNGNLWAYIYTDEAEFLKAFPNGAHYAEMRFVDVFKIVQTDKRFGGIFINSKSESFYLIPKELFGSVTKAVGQS